MSNNALIYALSDRSDAREVVNEAIAGYGHIQSATPLPQGVEFELLVAPNGVLGICNYLRNNGFSMTGHLHLEKPGFA